MAFGTGTTPKPRNVESRAGSVRSTTVVKDTQTGQTVMELEESQVLDKERFDKAPVIVTAGHDTNLSANFQSVRTTVSVAIPCTGNANDIEATFARAWELVDAELEKRAEWAKEVIEVYTEARKKLER